MTTKGENDLRSPELKPKYNPQKHGKKSQRPMWISKTQVEA
jgi:hypothetical protein